jgi:sulfur carrier protein ThiS
MKVILEREQSTKVLTFNGTVQALLKELHINEETVLVIRNNTVLTTEEILNNNDTIDILSVISGG